MVHYETIFITISGDEEIEHRFSTYRELDNTIELLRYFFVHFEVVRQGNFVCYICMCYGG